MKTDLGVEGEDVIDAGLPRNAGKKGQRPGAGINETLEPQPVGNLVEGHHGEGSLAARRVAVQTIVEAVGRRQAALVNSAVEVGHHIAGVRGPVVLGRAEILARESFGESAGIPGALARGVGEIGKQVARACRRQNRPVIGIAVVLVEGGVNVDLNFAAEEGSPDVRGPLQSGQPLSTDGGSPRVGRRRGDDGGVVEAFAIRVEP